MSEPEQEGYREQQDLQLIEESIEDLPPMLVKRQEKHRIILRNDSMSWLKKPFDQATGQNLKQTMVGT